MTFRQLQMYAAAAIMWGSSFYWLTITTPELGWGASVAFRSFLAAGLLLAFAYATKRTLDFQNQWKNMAVLGIFNVVMNVGGMNYAIIHQGTALTGILCSTIPFFSLLIEWVWHGIKPSASMFLGLIFGFVGVVIIIGFNAHPVDRELLLGVMGSMIAAVGFAFGGSYAKAKLPTLGSYEQTIGTFIFGGLWSLLFLLFVPIAVWPPSAKAVGALVVVALTASALAYIFYYKLIEEIGVTKALTTEFWIPVVAVLIGWLALDEVITFMQLVGAAMILVGCFIVMGLGKKKIDVVDTVAH